MTPPWSGSTARRSATQACISLENGQRDLERFAARAPVAAIGSSDFHGLGAMGLCRTYVFAADNSAQAIIDAVRVHRTVVSGKKGRPTAIRRWFNSQANCEALLLRLIIGAVPSTGSASSLAC